MMDTKEFVIILN